MTGHRMITASRAVTLVALAAAMAASGCAQPASSGRVRASAAARAACRSRADEVYLKQNRGEVYQADTYSTSTRDSPYTASGLPGITTNGLGGQYQRDQMEDDCLNASEDSRVQVTNPEPSVPASDIVRGTAPPPPKR